MIRLRSYLRPFLAPLMLAILLLFVQAFADLSLPDYMSRIVNVGIQQGGVESPVPEAISDQGMQLIAMLAAPEDRLEIERAYRRVDGESIAARASKFPGLKMEDYVLNIEGAPAEALRNAFGNVTWTLFQLSKSFGTSLGDGDERDGENESIQAPKRLPLEAVYRALPMLSTLPEEQLNVARSAGIDVDPSVKHQSALVLTRGFYEELGMDLAKAQNDYILRVGTLMLLVALMSGIAIVLVGLLSSRIASGVARALRRDVFQKIESFSSVEFDRFSTSSLITRNTNDINQIQQVLLLGIRLLCYAPILGIGGVFKAISKSPTMSWIIALALIVLIGIILLIMSAVVPKFKRLQTLVDRMNLVAREQLNGLMVVRAFGTDAHEAERFDEANKALTGTYLGISRIMITIVPVMMLIMNGVTVLIIWVGAHHIVDSTMRVGDMMAFMQYAIQIIMAFLMMSVLFIFIPRASVSGHRISEVLDTAPVIQDPKKPLQFPEGSQGVVVFDDVSFWYNGAEVPALEHISFTALPGQTTAIIGATGSGKTTIASLLLRFYDVTAGAVTLDGVDIRAVTQRDLRHRIGYVPQKGALLSGSIASNIGYGSPEASHSDYVEAAEVAQAIPFIEERPEGFDAPIGQGGANVSGGQKQRLSIARALTKAPDVLLFDDSFSALDYRTDRALRSALKAQQRKRTTLVIAQRVGTIMDAEQILVLDEGRIVGRGTHRELLQTCPEYYEIASSQLSEEELA